MYTDNDDDVIYVSKIYSNRFLAFVISIFFFSLHFQNRIGYVTFAIRFAFYVCWLVISIYLWFVSRTTIPFDNRWVFGYGFWRKFTFHKFISECAQSTAKQASTKFPNLVRFQRDRIQFSQKRQPNQESIVYISYKSVMQRIIIYYFVTSNHCAWDISHNG